MIVKATLTMMMVMMRKNKLEKLMNVPCTSVVHKLKRPATFDTIVFNSFRVSRKVTPSCKTQLQIMTPLFTLTTVG